MARRFRPGIGTSGGWSPFLSASTREAEDEALANEIEIIERALEDNGELPRKALGELTACKYWGPGRFGAALRAAVEQGRIERRGRGRYGPVGDRASG
jgi:hypothetical protein